MPDSKPPDIENERWELLAHITGFTDKFMTALAFVWLGLMIWEFTQELNQPLRMLGYAIWIIFGLDFLAKFLIAPKKMAYLRQNWLTAIALILPAFRALRIVRAARALRAVRLARVVTSINRSMRAVGTALRRRGVGYVVALTILITFAGAAGMYQLERPEELRSQGYGHVTGTGGGFSSYSEALWWTTMIMTTMGSQYWPVTPEGRLLCLLLALYAFAIFGYITATIASLFVGQDKKEDEAEKTTDMQEELRAIRQELATLRTQMVSRRKV